MAFMELNLAVYNILTGADDVATGSVTGHATGTNRKKYVSPISLYPNVVDIAKFEMIGNEPRKGLDHGKADYHRGDHRQPDYTGNGALYSHHT
jgi:hypothetical protein